MPRCRLESLGVSLPRKGLRRWGSIRHAVEAGRQCLRQSHYRPADVGLLINSGVYRDGHCAEPAMAVFIQHQLGINIEFQGRRTLSFDLQNGGCGMLSALHVLDAMLRSGDARVGMAVSSEHDSDRRPDPSYPYPASGAAVLLDLSPLGRVGFGAFAFHTDESAADLFSAVVSLEQKHGRLLLRREAALEQRYLACAAAAAEQALSREGLRREELSLIVPAQISGSFVASLPGTLGVEAGRVLDLTRELPDTHSTSLFLALHRALERQQLPAGSHSLLLAVGSGVTAGAAIYHF